MDSTIKRMPATLAQRKLRFMTEKNVLHAKVMKFTMASNAVNALKELIMLIKHV